MSDVGEQGDRLQVSLLEVHDALDMAVAAIGHAYEYGRPSTGPLLWDGAARDTTIGFEAAPGVTRAQVEGEARRVVTVGGSVTRVIDAVREHLGRGGSGARGAHHVDAAGTGLHELRAGFESGLKFAVPAAALERTAADVRQTAWYKSASDGQDFHWALVQHDGDSDQELAMSARSSATAAAGSGPPAWSSHSITSWPTSSPPGRCATPRSRCCSTPTASCWRRMRPPAAPVVAAAC